MGTGFGTRYRRNDTCRTGNDTSDTRNDDDNTTNDADHDMVPDLRNDPGNRKLDPDDNGGHILV